MRLIDADKIDFNEVFVGASDFARDTREAAQMLIDAQPTIEAIPVVHGDWEERSYEGECYDCGCLISKDGDFSAPTWVCMLPDWIKRIALKIKNANDFS